MVEKRKDINSEWRLKKQKRQSRIHERRKRKGIKSKGEDLGPSRGKEALCVRMFAYGFGA